MIVMQVAMGAPLLKTPLLNPPFHPGGVPTDWNHVGAPCGGWLTLSRVGSLGLSPHPVAPAAETPSLRHRTRIAVSKHLQQGGNG